MGRGLGGFINHVRRMDREIRRRGFMGYWCPNTPNPEFVPRTGRSLGREIRMRVAERDSWTCSYCRASVSPNSCEIDHVVPVALGGTDDVGNLALACYRCNRRKGKKPLDTFLVELIVLGLMGGCQWQESA